MVEDKVKFRTSLNLDIEGGCEQREDTIVKFHVRYKGEKSFHGTFIHRYTDKYGISVEVSKMAFKSKLDSKTESIIEDSDGYGILKANWIDNGDGDCILKVTEIQAGPNDVSSIKEAINQFNEKCRGLCGLVCNGEVLI